MSDNNSSGNDHSDKQIAISLEDSESYEEAITEEAGYNLTKSLSHPHMESKSSSAGSQSEDADSVATVFHQEKNNAQQMKSMENLMPAFKIGGVLSSRNGSNQEDNFHYLFSSKNSEIQKGNAQSYKNIDAIIPPINLLDCLPHSEISEPLTSPTATSVSSLTSNRKLEWDSGADVGYLRKYEQSSSLSTLERMALGNSASFLSLSNENESNLIQNQKLTKELLDKQTVPRHKISYTETDDTYCDSSDGKSDILRRVQMRQRFSKNHKVGSPKRKPKSLERGTGSVKPFNTKCTTCEEVKRHPRRAKHFGRCCHSNKQIERAINQSHLHSTPLCSSVSSGTSETLKAETYQSGRFNFPSFDSSSIYSNLSHLSHDKSYKFKSDKNCISEIQVNMANECLSKSSSSQTTLNETLSAISSSLKDLSVKLKIQAEYIAHSNQEFMKNNYKQICQWIEFIGMPAVDGADVTFKQRLAERVINTLTQVTKNEDVTGVREAVPHGDPSATVLKDIGHLSRKLGHKNKDSFYEDIKERCTTPGGTVICVPYRPPASTKTYYITVNEDLLLLEENQIIASPSKSPRSKVPVESIELNERAKDEEGLMMAGRISAEGLFGDSNAEASSDQSVRLQMDSTSRDQSSEISDVARPKLNLFRKSSSSSSESCSTERHQGLQETVASSFEFYSASSPDTNVPTIEERTGSGSQQETVHERCKSENDQRWQKQVKTTQTNEKDASKNNSSRKEKRRYNYEKSVLKCIEALQRIEKKLEWSNHPSFSDNSSIRRENIMEKNKILSSESSSDMCCTATTSSYQTTDYEESLIIHRNPSKRKKNRSAGVTSCSEVAPAGTRSVNVINASEISNLRKLLASTKLPGEARAHRFLLRDADPVAGNFASAVDRETAHINAAVSPAPEKDFSADQSLTLVQLNEGTSADHSSFCSVESENVGDKLQPPFDLDVRLDGSLMSDKSGNVTAREMTKEPHSSMASDLANADNRFSFRDGNQLVSKNVPLREADLVDSRTKESHAASSSAELAVVEENLKNLRLRCNNFKANTQYNNFRKIDSNINDGNILKDAKINHKKSTKEKNIAKINYEEHKKLKTLSENHYLDDKRKRTNIKFKMAQELDEMNKENGTTLKEALYMAKPAYVIAAECRRAKILRKTKLRQEVQAHNHSVLARLPESLKTPTTLQGFLVKNEESPLFNYNSMRKQNKRLVRLLPETNVQEAATKKDAVAVTNRLMGRLYSRKLRRKVLCGKVSHGHNLVVTPIS